jgi:outer membrane protein assembly factor BamE (lipoprotein component of BamABCDE complex)
MRVHPPSPRPPHPAAPPLATARPAAALRGLRALRLLAALAAAPLAGCSFFAASDVQRGQQVGADQLRELIPGTSTRADASSLLGSPTARAAFDDNTWIYISQITRSRVARVPGIDQQNVLVLSFNQAGTLQSVKHLTKQDAKSIDMVARATATPGSDSTFMQQLLGNIGHFTPGGLGGLGGGGGGSSLGQSGGQAP